MYCKTKLQIGLITNKSMVTSLFIKGSQLLLEKVDHEYKFMLRYKNNLYMSGELRNSAASYKLHNSIITTKPEIKHNKVHCFSSVIVYSCLKDKTTLNLATDNKTDVIAKLKEQSIVKLDFIWMRSP